jgi:hypothetical protein
MGAAAILKVHQRSLINAPGGSLVDLWWILHFSSTVI